MEIEETKKKLYLVAYNPRKKIHKQKDEVDVSISKKSGKMYFNKEMIREMEFEGKFIKLSYDSGNRVIAWMIRDKLNIEEVKNGWKMIRADKKNGRYIVNIAFILSTFQLSEKNKCQHCIVRKYKEKSLLSDDYYYFIKVE